MGITCYLRELTISTMYSAPDLFPGRTLPQLVFSSFRLHFHNSIRLYPSLNSLENNQDNLDTKDGQRQTGRLPSK